MNGHLAIFLRSLGAFIVLLVLTRIMGRKQISQLTFFDYIVGITIGSIAAVVAVDDAIEVIDGIISLAVWGLLPILIGYLTLKSLAFRRTVDGEPLIVIKNGVILEKNMSKAKYNVGDLLMQLREKNVFDLNEVEFAVFEPNGELSVLKKSQYNPVTAKDLNIPTNYKGLMTELILNGQILEDRLHSINLDTPWLLDQLRMRNIEDVNSVIFAGIQTDGQLYIACKNKTSQFH